MALLALTIAVGVTPFAGKLSAQDLYVGSNTPNNTTNFTSGTNSYANTYVGYTTNASNNLLTVVNSGTLLANSINLYLGYDGSSNSLIISNGGGVVVYGNPENTNGISTNGVQIGYAVTSSNNSLLVTGPNSYLSTTNGVDQVAVGYSSSGNSMVISNQAQVSSALGIIGINATSSNNTVLVTGTNSLWFNNNLTVGYSGNSNSLVISNGGTVALYGSTNTNTTLVPYNAVCIGAFNSSSNSIIVTGTNSSLICTNNSGPDQGEFYGGVSSGIEIGYDGGSGNSLVVSNGASVQYSYLWIGYGSTNSNSCSSNSVIVTGPGSTMTTPDSAAIVLGYLSNSSANSLIISNQGTVFCDNLCLGNSTNANNNSVLVTGTNSFLSAVYGTNNVAAYVGSYGSGNTLTISNGGTVAVYTTQIGSDSSNNLVAVTGLGSRLTNRKATLVGNYGSGNRLVISDGGSVATPTNSFIGYQTNSSNNSVLVTGAGSLWSNSNLYVGYQGMSSSLIISHGGTVVATNSFIGYETNSSNNSVLVTGVGSLWSNSGTITIGTTNGGGGNSLTINNGGLVLASGGINIQSGTLGGDGTVGTATTIGSGVNLIPGSSISGSLTFTQGLVLQSGSTTTFQINTKTDFTSINMVGNSITYGGNLVFNILNYTPARGDVFTLVNMTEGAVESGNFSSVAAGSLIFIDNGGIWTANDGSYLYQFSDSTGQLTVQAVTTFASWSGNAAVTSDLLSRYAFGAADKNSAPETMTTSITSAKLSLTAVVRIDDSSLTVVGEAGVDLVGWSSDRVSMVPSSNQTNVPNGCQRQVFSVEIASSTPRQFLRLRAIR